MMTKERGHSEVIGEIIRKIRGTRTLREFAAELGVSGEAVRLWESGGQVADATLLSWWNDPRPWVRDLARDVIVAKFVGIREALQAESNGHSDQAAAE